MVAKQAVSSALAAVTKLSAVLVLAAGTGWGQWTATEKAKLTASDGASGDSFGRSVALSGDTAIVGAFGDDHLDVDEAGSAYVFVRGDSTWTEQAKLIASDWSFHDYFGCSVSLSGDTAVIGAYAWGDDAGSAYVFVRSGSSWTEQAKLTASDGEYGDWFGNSVSVSGDTIVVGAYSDDQSFSVPDVGSAYVFVRSGTHWIQQAKLTASAPAGYDFFGNSVSVSGDTVVVGAPYNDHSAMVNPGSAYVFVRSGTSWTEQAKLTANDAAPGDSFGESVSLSGDTTVVGAVQGNNAGGTDAGSAYVFVRNGASWTEQAKLTASDAGPYDYFGRSVSLSGDRAVVGALSDFFARGISASSAYVFSRSGANWVEQTKLTASDGEAGDWFGYSVSISGSTVLVGASQDDPEGGRMTSVGSAYVFQASLGPAVSYCTAGTSASGCQALLSATGTASATAPSGFTLQVATVEGQKDGLFFFGTNGQQANSWGNGTSYQCVVPPVVRAGTLAGTGTVGLCDGSFSQDLNALWCPSCPKPAKNPGAGAVVQAQLWYRDPLSTSNQTTSLSDAVEFVVGL